MKLLHGFKLKYSYDENGILLSLIILIIKIYNYNLDHRYTTRIFKTIHDHFYFLIMESIIINIVKKYSSRVFHKISSSKYVYIPFIINTYALLSSDNSQNFIL